MKLKVVDRRKVLREFNELNGTTNPSSAYVGVRVIDNDSPRARLMFLHTNGEGREFFSPAAGGHLRGLRVDDSYKD